MSVAAQPPPPAPRTIEFLKGGGAPVCEAYTDWLRRGQPAGSTFNVDLGEKFFGFNYEREALLLENVEAFLWARDVNPANYFLVTQMSQWTRTPEQIADARRGFHDAFERDIDSGYQVGRVDIDNDGVSDDIFVAARQGGATLLVLNAEKTDVDRARTERIFAHPSRAAAGWPEVRPPWPDGDFARFPVLPVTDAYEGARYDVFVFRDSTYVRFLWATHPEHSNLEWIKTGTQHIFRINRLEKTEVCEYRVR